MDHLTLPEEDWDSLQNLALGTSVLQLGFTDGMDTNRLARTASFVLAVGRGRMGLRANLEDPFVSWWRMVDAAGNGDRVLGTAMPWSVVLPMWAPGSFGLAVLNPYALDPLDLPAAATVAEAMARRLVVIDGAEGEAEPAVSLLFEGGDTSVVRSGRLLVVSPRVTAAAADGGGV